MSKETPKAPARAGRPRFGETPMRSRTIRLTDRQAEKLYRLGGGAWIRKRIDEAKDPAEQ